MQFKMNHRFILSPLAGGVSVQNTQTHLEHRMSRHSKFTLSSSALDSFVPTEIHFLPLVEWQL